MEQEQPKVVVIRRKKTKKTSPTEKANQTRKNKRCQNGFKRDPKNPENCIEKSPKPPAKPNDIEKVENEEPKMLEEPTLAKESPQMPDLAKQENVLPPVAPRRKRVQKNNKQIVIESPPETQNTQGLQQAVLNDSALETYLYPHVGDEEFSYKLAKHKEFFDTQYDGRITDIKHRANQLCNTEFELMPHQLFVRNFLSVQTPYNGLLLYMGLGSGKTCSAIGIAEEMRLYIKQSGLDQEPKINKTLIIAAPNVQDNFLVQLFDEDKLKEENGIWNIESCVGNKLIREVNPTHVKGLSKTTLANNIRRVIDRYYSMMGYSQFANYAERVIYGENNEYLGNTAMEIKNIKENFSNRLLIIDEVHNIRDNDQEQDKTKGKAISKILFYIVENAENLRLVLLSATPMYNSYQEIIWLTNLLNVNDKRPKIREEDVFDKKGNFIKGGQELLQSKLYGYVSYVRGENPYTFPYRLYPSTFAPEHSKQFTMPTTTFTKKEIFNSEKLSFLEIFGTSFVSNSYQAITYKLMVDIMQGTYLSEEEQKSNFGYSALTSPLQALNFVFPSLIYDVFHREDASTPAIQDFIGSNGLNVTMDYTINDKEIYAFDYKPLVLEKFGRIFSPEHLSNYGAKLASIVKSISNADGISLVYSQYIDGGLVPLALALEEIGYTKYDSKSLFKTPPSESNGFKYVMITGNTLYSKDNAAALKAINAENNMNGEKIKVVLISFAGSEGLDYKNIRQIHIMDPWYNMNRLEQIIGRGVRNLSHCKLLFEQRNVEIYLHVMFNVGSNESEECIDLYMYRLSEKKAIQIGRVTRMMKQISVDCLLNIKQHGLTVENLQTIPENNEIVIRPASSKSEIKFLVGDRSFSNTCDYMESCELKCHPDKLLDKDSLNKVTYGQYFVESNQERIIQLIKQMFKEQVFYKRSNIISYVNTVKQYPIDQIYSTLTFLIGNKNEPLIDKYGRTGVLVNRNDVYAFQPMEINDTGISIYDRAVPIQYKHKKLDMKVWNYDQEPTMNPLSDAPETVVSENENISANNPIHIIEQYTRHVFDVEPNPPRSEWNFYNYLKNVLGNLRELHMLNDQLLKQYIVEHALETMEHDMLLQVLHASFFANTDNGNESEVMNIIKSYFRRNSTTYSNIPCVPIAKGNETLYYLYSETEKTWKENKGIKEVGKTFYRILDRYQEDKYIGFYHAGTFRIKDLSNRKAKFAVVNQKGKTEIKFILNEIFEKKKAGIRYPDSHPFDQNSIAVILEMVMRYYSSNFFTPVEANESIIRKQ